MPTEKTIVVDYVRPERLERHKNRKAPLSSYTLALLCGQSPKTLEGCRVETRIFDEATMGAYDPSKAKPDILCLTYLTTGAPRAFEISDQAKSSKAADGGPIKVVHGGVHATSLPTEALKHCDVVVRGEASPRFQGDVLSHALKVKPGDKSVVRMSDVPKTLSRPPANWEWINRKATILGPSLQTSVGCPFHCEFCSVTEVFGAGMRVVEEDSLRAEVANLRRGSVLAIVDDNFLQGVQPRHTDHCIMVASLLKEMGFRWVAELTLRTLSEARKALAASRPGFDLIEFFAKNGCVGLYFGIETVDDQPGNLKKVRPMAETLEVIKACHANGLGVLGAFVLGVGPNETSDHPKRILEFAIEDAKLDFAQFSINTPMPGARNFVTGVRDGRIFNFNWELYDAEHCVMRHPTLSPEELEEQHRWLYREFYSFRSGLQRTEILPLLSLSPGAWKRLAIRLPAGYYLHRTNRLWEKSVKSEQKRALVPAPDPVVMDQIQAALAWDPQRPKDLFSLGQPDGLSMSLTSNAN